MAVPLMIIGGVAMLAGQGVNMYSSIQQGKFQKDMANYQSDLAKQRAKLAEQNAEIQAGRLAESRRMETASGMTGFAANGMLIDDAPAAAPNIWEQDMAAETAWQQEAIRTQAMYEAWGLNADASMLTAQGSMARRGATYGAWGIGLSTIGQGAMMGAAAAAMAGGSGPTAGADQWTGADAGLSGAHADIA